MSAPLRVLFCIGINQNFFDLPTGHERRGLDGVRAMLDEHRGHGRGPNVLGTIDDDAHMVGPSDGWPWTAYVLADVRTPGDGHGRLQPVPHHPSASTPLWRYAKVEARIGRELVVQRADVEQLEATS